jgi:hypothetical protein
MRDAQVAFIPEFLFVLIQLPRTRSNIKKDDLGVSIYQPCPSVDLNTENI